MEKIFCPAECRKTYYFCDKPKIFELEQSKKKKFFFFFLIKNPKLK